MARKNVSVLVSGAGWIGGLIDSLIKELRQAGVPDEDIHQLVVADNGELRERLVATFVAEIRRSKGGVDNALGSKLQWFEKFFQDSFSIRKDFSDLWIPPHQDGFDRLLVMAEGMRPGRLFEKASSLFNCWPYSGNLDNIFSERKTNRDYAVWVRDAVEADEDMRGKSAFQILAEQFTTETLEERILHELVFHAETKEHLDITSWTYCAGSRHPDGNVPCGSCSRGGFGFSPCDPGNAADPLRARVVVC